MQVVREHRARLVGGLARWCGDVQLAEDGFADAVERALMAWPSDMPRDPTAWIVTTARNRIRDILKSAERTRTTVLDERTPHRAVEDHYVRDDDTLALMLACAHPLLDRAVHAPLILQVVIGSQTTDIATAFALPSATLAKRLVRAKQRLRADPDAFEVPEGIPTERVQSVLDAIYAAYSIEWLRVSPTDAVDLVTEQAIHASQLMLQALPGDHEARGLAALLLYLHSRRDTRIRDGVLVPTDEQDPAQWDHELIRRAEGLLRFGLARPRESTPGPYELQAAIQSAHASRSGEAQVPWETVARLYDALILVTPSKGASVARAVAIARATDAGTGLRILDELGTGDASLEAFQPFHA
ncbi:MAG: hypothetical protein JHD16_10580, partial [Solirubrobacteraceae bacterium]|nr:hypothetical protein [Solirubrobacteraceae bacterium]